METIKRRQFNCEKTKTLWTACSLAILAFDVFPLVFDYKTVLVDFVQMLMVTRLNCHLRCETHKICLKIEGYGVQTTREKTHAFCNERLCRQFSCEFSHFQNIKKPSRFT